MAQVTAYVTRPDQLAGVPSTVENLTLQFDQLDEQQLAAVPWRS